MTDEMFTKIPTGPAGSEEEQKGNKRSMIEETDEMHQTRKQTVSQLTWRMNII